MEFFDLKIAQLSDIHLSGNSDVLNGIPVFENFKKALYSESVQKSDFIVFSGDLADSGELNAYHLFISEMKKVNKPWCFIPGNHDNLQNMVQAGFDNQLSMRSFVQNKIVFRTENFENETLDYSFQIRNKNFVFLDTKNGMISEKQMEWLKIFGNKQEEFYLWTHYPPCFCNHAFMDSKYAFKEIDKIQNLLSGFKNLRFIFSGHYHADYKIELPSKQIVYSAPAVQMQIDSDSLDFKLKSVLPAWQIISFSETSVSVQVYK